jgi:phosphoribosylformylglycinamidine cyclo-ligase
MASGIEIHYLSHITGHGFQKLMRARAPFTYRIRELPSVPEVLEFMVATEGMSDREAYSTFNMGCGFAVYCRAGDGEDVVRLAAAMGLVAIVAGSVEDGPRRTILPNGVVFEGGELDLAPRAAVR